MGGLTSWVTALFRSSEQESAEQPTVHDLAAARRKRGATPMGMELIAGRYRLDTLVGRGSSGLVYRAWDAKVDQTVAIKILNAAGPGLEASLRDEVRAAMRLGHPRILRVFHYDVENDVEYLVMEYVSGLPLHRMLELRPTGRLAVREVVKVGIDLLDALSYAHDASVVHHDVKPSNVLWCNPGGIKVCDFGLARVSGQPWSPAVAGTPAFMSPERLRGEAGDARSDLYSLGATLYDLAEGCPPFGTEQTQAASGHLHLPPPRAGRLPGELADVLVRALAKAPTDRWRSAAEMRAAWEDAARRALSEAPTHPVDTRLPRPEPPTDRQAEAAPRAEPAPRIEPAPRAEPPPRIEPARQAEPPPRAEPARQAEPAPADLVEIPAGALAPSAGGPGVTVGRFFVERDLVTCARYAEFLLAAGGLPPKAWSRAEPPRGLDDHPVTGVTLDDARRYAAWRGRRLPTATEWERAARPDGRPFPWGDAWDPARCHGPHRGTGTTAPVGSYPSGATPLGCRDLIGNVWQWTDPADAPPEPGYAWVYGGSWRHAGHRDGRIARTSVSAQNAYDYLGFRCVADGGRYR